jgi:asparagine synthase (glutamine-hydrolysing)
MCGITGIFDFSSKRNVDMSVLKKMTDIIAHRGPDDEGFYLDELNGIGFGHRRLSIIDLKSGNQPMSNQNGDILIVFNGEIYNYFELKDELIRKGHNFKTNCDTEVIIHFYEEYGEDWFFRLKGIFAFAIYDKRNKSLLLARDHFGVKPLYYSIDSKQLLFGSEIKSLLIAKPELKNLDLKSLDTFLTFRFNPSPQTLFKDVKKLNPGFYLKFESNGQFKLNSFWDCKPKTNYNIPFKDAVLEYQRLLENAIIKQMMSDVPLGLLLSGGIDSAVIAKVMSLNSDKKIKSFTIGFEGKGDYNELDDAKNTSHIFGTEHYDILLKKKDYLESFFNSFYYTEEPIAETTIPSLFCVSKLASEHVKVVLTGQGADEPLAGYKRYFGEKILGNHYSLFERLPMKILQKFFKRNERVNRISYASRFADELERFVAIYTIFTPEQKNKLWNKNIFRENTDNTGLVRNLYLLTENYDVSFSKILYIDTRLSLSDDLLLFGDKMSMANSLEMRVPYLDLDLINFLESIPSSYKLRGFNHKYIHKKAINKWLPNNIIQRKKRGFSTPMDEWLQEEFSNEVKTLLNSEDSACREFFNIDYINEIINHHQNKKANFYRQIFSLLSFEIWYKTFLKKI